MSRPSLHVLSFLRTWGLSDPVQQDNAACSAQAVPKEEGSESPGILCHSHLECWEARAWSPTCSASFPSSGHRFQAPLPGHEGRQAAALTTGLGLRGGQPVRSGQGGVRQEWPRSSGRPSSLAVGGDWVSGTLSAALPVLRVVPKPAARERGQGLRLWGWPGWHTPVSREVSSSSQLGLRCAPRGS